MLYLIIALVALTAFSSLAVDLGRVYVARAELQLAADAAARYGAAGMATGVTAAIDNAVNAADDNKADGTTVVLDRNADVELGNWDQATRTFTALSGAARSNGNAIRVTARRTGARGNAVPLTWASVIGSRTCDVTVTAVATCNRSDPYGVVGLQGISLDGSSRIDSYRSAQGGYGGANVLNTGTVASNGAITSGGSSVLFAGAESALGPVGTAGANAVRTGSLAAPLTYPLPPTGGLDGRDGDFTGRTLAAGTYYFRNFTPGTPLTLAGPVVVHVSGNVGSLRNVLTYQNVPANFRLVLTTSATVDLDIDLSGNRDYYMDLYAPNVDLNMSGSADVYGKVVVRSINLGGNSGIHVDESLVPPSAARGVMLVK